MLTVVGEIASSRGEDLQGPPHRAGRRTASRRCCSTDGPLAADDVLRQDQAHLRVAGQAAAGRAARASSSARPAGSAASGSSPTRRWCSSATTATTSRRAVVEAIGALYPIYPLTKGVESWDIQRAVTFARTVLDDPRAAARGDPHAATTCSTPAGASTGSTRPTTTARWRGRSGGSGSRRRWSPSWCWPGAGARSARWAPWPATAATARCWPRSTSGCRSSSPPGQREIGEQIEHDLAQPHPMNRLLQGEVGSGKTLVALRAMLRVVDSGGQAALLAPTEVLAQQHHRSITAMLGDLAVGRHARRRRRGHRRSSLLTGSMTKTQRTEPLLRHRQRRGRHRHRHPRAARGAGLVRRPRPGRRRRAAPLRRRAARRPHRQGRGARRTCW